MPEGKSLPLGAATQQRFRLMREGKRVADHRRSRAANL
jgi:hypothetical protein